MIVHRDPEGRGPAESFRLVADVYERSRPEYPDGAVSWLVGDEPLDVVDLGAGTGKLTRSLARLGHRVTAVEPLPEMLDQLRAAVPGVTALEGSAEAIPLDDASVDAVTCAQAFHWFDHPAAIAEMARVLRPGGHAALVWNARDDRVPWIAELSAAIGAETVNDLDVSPEFDASGLFEPVEQADFDHAQPLDRESLRELVLSRSYCAMRTPEEREPIIAEVDAIFDRHAVDGLLTILYVTVCFRARCLTEEMRDGAR